MASRAATELFRPTWQACTQSFFGDKQVKRTTEEEEANCLCSGPLWLVDIHMDFSVQVWYRKFSNTWMRSSKERLQNCGVLYISIWAAAHFWFIVKPKKTWATTIWMLTATRLAKQVWGGSQPGQVERLWRLQGVGPKKLNLYSKRSDGWTNCFVQHFFF